MKIVFVTTNKGKVFSLQRRLDPKKYTIEQSTIEPTEIQADSCKEISIAKAKEAYSILRQPLVVHDASFHVPALNDFPGPYSKYVEETIGIDGLLQLLKNKKDRSCYFLQSLAYITNEKEVKVFIRKEVGTLTKERYPVTTHRSWGDLWSIYIPEGYDKPLAAFSEEEFKLLEKVSDAELNSEFDHFVKWLNK